MIAAAVVGLAAFGRQPVARVEPARVGLQQAARTALVAAGGVYADGFVARARHEPRCHGLRVVRSGPNKYALGRCTTFGRARAAPLAPPRRLLAESYFASLIADDTCAGRDCNASRHGGARWVLVGGRAGVRPRTVAECPRYRNIEFATDRPIGHDRLLRTIPRGEQVHWRYASRGGGWVMAYWRKAPPYNWAFIPRSCVSDPPAWSELALWRPGQPRPTHGRRIRILRPALPCPSRLRCSAPNSTLATGP